MRFFSILAVLTLETLVCPIFQINALPQQELSKLVHITYFARVKATAYDPDSVQCVGRWANVFPRRTATNTDAEQPGLGADFKVFPRGTFIHLPGIGFRRVDDTGSGSLQQTRLGIKHLDVRMPKRPGDKPGDALRRAKNFHVQWMDVEVWPEGYVPIFSLNGI